MEAEWQKRKHQIESEREKLEKDLNEIAIQTQENKDPNNSPELFDTPEKLPPPITPFVLGISPEIPDDNAVSSFSIFSLRICCSCSFILLSRSTSRSVFSLGLNQVGIPTSILVSPLKSSFELKSPRFNVLPKAVIY